MSRRTLPLMLAATLALAAFSTVASEASATPDKPTWHRPGPVETGRILGWTGGTATLRATAGFFGNVQFLSTGRIRPDGTFRIALPARPPADTLGLIDDECSTLSSTDPAARFLFAGNYLIFRHGRQAGATHSGSTFGIASFTNFDNGATRTGWIYVDRATTFSGTCQRTLDFGGFAVDFTQNLDLPLTRGWHSVIATFTTPQPGKIHSTIRVGTNRTNENWYFFTPPA